MEILGGTSGVGNEDSKWRGRFGFCIRLCRPRFRHPFQSGHPHRDNTRSSSRYTGLKGRLWMTQGCRRPATSRWRETRSSMGMRSPKAAEPEGNPRHLLYSSPCPYRSNLLWAARRGFEKRFEGESDCMLRPDLWASARGHQWRMTSMQRTRAITRASAGHCSGRSRDGIESSSERIERIRARGRERRGRVGSDSRCDG